MISTYIDNYKKQKNRRYICDYSAVEVLMKEIHGDELECLVKVSIEQILCSRCLRRHRSAELTSLFL